MESQVEKFYKIHSKFYDATRWMFLPARKKAVVLLDIKPGDSVIDFACGTGYNIRHFPEEQVDISGIDCTDAMLQRAKKKFPLHQFINGDITSYRYTKPADKIICTYALSLVTEWKKAILNMKDTLEEHGTLVILDFYPIGSWAKFMNPLLKWWLRTCHVDMDKAIIPFLKEHFTSVEVKTGSCGYYFLAKARMR